MFRLGPTAKTKPKKILIAGPFQSACVSTVDVFLSVFSPPLHTTALAEVFPEKKSKVALRYRCRPETESETWKKKNNKDESFEATLLCNSLGSNRRMTQADTRVKYRG